MKKCDFLLTIPLKYQILTMGSIMGAAKLSIAKVAKVLEIKSQIKKLFQGQMQDLRWSRGGKLILARSQKCLFFTGNIPSCGIGCVDSDREIERCSILLSSSRDWELPKAIRIPPPHHYRFNPTRPPHYCGPTIAHLSCTLSQEKHGTFPRWWWEEGRRSMAAWVGN